MRKLTSLQKGLIIYLSMIVLLLVLAWGVNAIVAANPVRSPATIWPEVVAPTIAPQSVSSTPKPVISANIATLSVNTKTTPTATPAPTPTWQPITLPTLSRSLP
jgi:hypothetical protein